MNTLRELQIAEEEAFEDARRDSTTESEDGSPNSAGETVKPRRIAVHSEEMQKVLERIGCDKEGGRMALAAATRDLREKRKEETGVKSLRKPQKEKENNAKSKSKQVFYDCSWLP